MRLYYKEKYMRIKSIKKVEAFSLTELLIALAIVGILVLIALPNFTQTINDAHAQEAKLQLKHVYTLQKNYYYTHSKYSDNLEEIGFIQEKTVTEEGLAKYVLEIVEATPSSFMIKAISVVDFDHDGTFNEWMVDQTGNIKETVND